MDESNLKTASLYINNQLLSRGLLRNGQTIDFARPDRDAAGEKGRGVLESTMGRVMGVVNDLILRRDRDATQRENLTTTIRTIKADSLRQTTELERLHAKFAESQRKLGIAEATERALKLQIKSAESKERGLREEMARMKELVKQTRNQCAVEVRKREKVIEGLKKHVGDGRVRGGGKNPGTREVVVIGGIGEKEDKLREGGMVAVGEDGYDLRSETNEFLTELARGLSEENENLTALARRTLENLKALSGWEKDTTSGPGMVVEMETGYEALAADMEAVIEHVRTLLTNPSFVPLEEVEVREEEIIRLREGWERMESRWNEAVQMMDGWRKRMARSGQTVNLEELKLGLSLSPLKPKEDEKEQIFQLSTLEEEEAEGDTQADIDVMDEIVEPNFDEEMDESDSSMFEEQEPEPVEEEELREQEATFVTESSAMSPPQLSPLKETSGNRYIQHGIQEKEGFTTIVEENTFDLLQLATSPEKSKPSVKSTPQSTRREPQNQPLATPPEDEVALLSTSLPPIEPPQQSSSRSSPQKSTRSNPAPTPKLRMGPESRLPRPRDTSAPMQSPLTMATIAAKLAASEREADAARVRAKLKAARAGRVASGPKLTQKETIRRVESVEDLPKPQIEAEVEVEKEGGEIRSRKRKAVDAGRRDNTRAKANRRRSTLSPWELESLMLGGVGGLEEGS